MTERTQVRRRLTGTEMDKIKAAAAVSWQSALVETWLCFGVDLTAPLAEGEQPIRPYDYAIPRDQWGVIAQWCGDSPHGSDIGRVNHMLDWMNYGPSGYGPEPERTS